GIDIQRVHGVELEEVEPDETQVCAVERPVAQAARPERAAVADAVVQHAPRVAPLAAVPPGDLRHLEVVVRLGRERAEGRGPSELDLPELDLPHRARSVTDL